jgi:hypothetical protein
MLNACPNASARDRALLALFGAAISAAPLLSLFLQAGLAPAGLFSNVAFEVREPVLRQPYALGLLFLVVGLICALVIRISPRLAVASALAATMFHIAAAAFLLWLKMVGWRRLPESSVAEGVRQVYGASAEISPVWCVFLWSSLFGSLLWLCRQQQSRRGQGPGLQPQRRNTSAQSAVVIPLDYAAQQRPVRILTPRFPYALLGFAVSSLPLLTLFWRYVLFDSLKVFREPMSCWLAPSGWPIDRSVANSFMILFGLGAVCAGLVCVSARLALVGSAIGILSHSTILIFRCYRNVVHLRGISFDSLDSVHSLLKTSSGMVLVWSLLLWLVVLLCVMSRHWGAGSR